MASPTPTMSSTLRRAQSLDSGLFCLQSVESERIMRGIKRTRTSDLMSARPSKISQVNADDFFSIRTDYSAHSENNDGTGKDHELEFSLDDKSVETLEKLFDSSEEDTVDVGLTQISPASPARKENLRVSLNHVRYRETWRIIYGSFCTDFWTDRRGGER